MSFTNDNTNNNYGDYFNKMYNEPSQEATNFLINKPDFLNEVKSVEKPKEVKVSYGAQGLVNKYQNNFGVKRYNFGSNFFNPVVKDVNKTINNKFII